MCEWRFDVSVCQRTVSWGHIRQLFRYHLQTCLNGAIIAQRRLDYQMFKTTGCVGFNTRGKQFMQVLYIDDGCIHSNRQSFELTEVTFYHIFVISFHNNMN